MKETSKHPRSRKSWLRRALAHLYLSSDLSRWLDKKDLKLLCLFYIYLSCEHLCKCMSRCVHATVTIWSSKNNLRELFLSWWRSCRSHSGCQAWQQAYVVQFWRERYPGIRKPRFACSSVPVGDSFPSQVSQSWVLERFPYASLMILLQRRRVSPVRQSQISFALEKCYSSADPPQRIITLCSSKGKFPSQSVN